jgi:cbb3-type cytochrome oxidase subunit 3
MVRLSDIVGASGLAGYAIVALVLFFAAFLLVLIPIFAPARREMFDRAARMPLDEPAPGAPETR